MTAGDQPERTTTTREASPNNINARHDGKSAAAHPSTAGRGPIARPWDNDQLRSDHDIKMGYRTA